MKPSRILLLTVLIHIVSSCSDLNLKSKLNELKNVLDEKEYYSRLFEERMDAARSGLITATNDSLRWGYAYKLFSNYFYSNIDSCGKYLGILDSLSTTDDLRRRYLPCEIRYLCVTKDRESVKEKLKLLESRPISEPFINDYYSDLDRCYTFIRDGEWYRTIAGEALAIPGLDETLRLKFSARLNIINEKPDKALEDFTNCFNTSSDYHVKAMAAYNIALLNENGDRDVYKYWLAEAAINDLKVPVKDYSSLYSLSMALFEDSNLPQAAEFMTEVLNDALSRGSSNGIFKTAENFSVIVKALNYSERSRMKSLRYFIASLLALIAVILSLLIRQVRQRRRLSTSNEVISDLNGRLTDANRIKENYLFRYMKLSVTYLGQVNEMKHLMRKTLKEEGVDALIKLVRTPPSHDGYIDFYKIFDDTFLSLYPDFVEEVNMLLKPELQFEKKTPMKMEMRILAAIRLGFTDSGQIAEFLHCAPNSIYTNRSKLKRSALCDKDEFEDRIRALS